MSENTKLSYVDYSFDSLVDQLQNHLRTTEAWKDVYVSSTGQMLIELFAAVGNMVLYYIERRAEECYIETSKNYSSVVNLVRLLNYTPKRSLPSKGQVRLSIDTPSSKIIYIPQYTKLSSTDGTPFIVYPIGGQIAPGSTSVDLTALQGELTTVSFTSNGDLNQSYKLNYQDIADYVKDSSDTLDNTPKIEVTVNSIPWTLQETFLNSTPQATHYCLKSELDGTVTVLLGDNIFGKSPSSGDVISISFIRTKGVDGNVYSTDVITKLNSLIYDQDGVRQTVNVTNIEAFHGGTSVETIEQIKNNAPKVFSSGDRLVTKQDYYAHILGGGLGVVDVNVWGESEENPPNYNLFNVVKICPILQNWDIPALNNSFWTRLSEYLNQKAMLTVKYEYVQPVIINVVPSLIVKAHSNVSLNLLQAAVDNVIREQFILGLTVYLDDNKYHGDLVAVVEAVPGVKYSHVNLKISKELETDFISTYTYAQVMDTDFKPGTVELYIESEKIAEDDGVGNWTNVKSGYTVTGSIDYTERVVGASITGIESGKVYCLYGQDNNGNILVEKNQVCKLDRIEYIQIS